MTPRPVELQSEIAAKEAKQVELLGQLERSLALRRMWPEAFQIPGSVKGLWTVKHDLITIQWTRSDGLTSPRFTLDELPPELWPSQATRDKYKRDFPRAKWSRKL